MSLPAARSPHDLHVTDDALHSLADGLPIGVLLLERGRVRWANGKALQLWAADAAQLGARTLDALFLDPEAIRDCLATPCDRETRLRRFDGDTLQVRIGTHALVSGTRRLLLLHVSDLTDSERIRAEMAAQREELQTLARRLLTVQEDERRTLSRELHDDIGQQLTAIKLGAIALQDESEPALRAELLAEILATTDQTLAKLRDLSMLLRPPQLDALGLEAALRWQAERMFRSGRPRLSLSLTPLPHRPDP